MARRSNSLVDFSRQVVWPLGALILFLVLLHLSPLPLKHVFIVVFTAVLLAAAVSPAARFLSRYHIPRGVTILFGYVLAILILIGVIALIVPLIVAELTSLQVALPAYVFQAQDQLTRLSPGFATEISTADVVQSLKGSLSAVVSGLTDLAFSFFSISINVVIVLVMAYFMAAQENFARLAITRFVPVESRERVLRLMGRIGTRMGEWARAQLLLAIFFGLAFGAGLRLAGIRYAVTLAVIGAVLEVIPYVGGFITVAVAVLVTLTQRPVLVIFVLAWYFVVVEIEGHVIAPKLMNRVLGIHPLVVVLALFLGGESLGILGALLAVPIAIVLEVLLDEFYALDSGRRITVSSNQQEIAAAASERGAPDSAEERASVP
jgi:predicted PurR-regulated permease PerM